MIKKLFLEDSVVLTDQKLWRLYMSQNEKDIPRSPEDLSQDAQPSSQHEEKG